VPERARREKTGLLAKDWKANLEIRRQVGEAKVAEQERIGATVELERQAETENTSQTKRTADQEQCPDLKQSRHCAGQGAKDKDEI
jgi:hypothetical protein